MTWERFNAQKSELEKTANILKLLGQDVPPAMGFLYSEKGDLRGSPTFLGPSMSEITREAVQNVKAKFTRNDVVEWITANYPDRDIKPLSIGSYLSAMVSEGKLVVLVKGVGPVQSVYCLKVNLPDPFDDI